MCLAPGQNMRRQAGYQDHRRAHNRHAARHPAAEARRIIEVRGSQRYIVPGLIDLHAHVAYGATTLGVGMECCDPDIAGVHAGVTTA